MSTVLSRIIASVPTRTASETWERIMELLAHDPRSAGRAELEKVAGVAVTAIASEATKNDAVVVSGNGPHIRIYCVFGEDAISGDGVNEDVFQKYPTEGDWVMSIPCLPEDLKWVQKKLKACSDRVTARATGEKWTLKESRASSSKDSNLEIDAGEFLKS